MLLLGMLLLGMLLLGMLSLGMFLLGMLPLGMLPLGMLLLGMLQSMLVDMVAGMHVVMRIHMRQSYGRHSLDMCIGLGAGIDRLCVHAFVMVGIAWNLSSLYPCIPCNHVTM